MQVGTEKIFDETEDIQPRRNIPTANNNFSETDKEFIRQYFEPMSKQCHNIFNLFYYGGLSMK